MHRQTKLIIVVGLIGIAIFAYCLNFHSLNISKSTSDWGNFGSYFSGILSLVSIWLLYETLSEQRIENHRNWFDAGFERRCHDLISMHETNKNIIWQLSDKILKSCDHSIFDDNCKKEDAKLELSNLYEENLTTERNISEKLYRIFKNTFLYIISDHNLTRKIKESYVYELENSIYDDSLIIILCVVSNLQDDDFIYEIGKYKSFISFQSSNVGFDVLKDALFNYNSTQKYEDN